MLRARWLGKVAFNDAHALQTALFNNSRDDYLLLLEHPHVITKGLRARDEHILADPDSINAEVIRTNRGGDVTYHGPGQLVGYPILELAPPHPLSTTPAYVYSVEQVVIDALADLGLAADRLSGFPGVWVGVGTDNPRKIAAVGVRYTRGRTMHGFAINVDPDMSYFDAIIPCGIPDKDVTSLAQEGISVSMREVVNAICRAAEEQWANGEFNRDDLAWNVVDNDLSVFSKTGEIGELVKPSQPVKLLSRSERAGIDNSSAIEIAERKPEWLRVEANMGAEYRDLKKKIKSLDLVTVCEEAGCPNIYECWKDGTATFMILGERCTRACGFCLVDTRKPSEVDLGEPERVAQAVAEMNLAHAVLTMVARDDLADGGAAIVAESIETIRRQTPDTDVEVLISDMQGNKDSLLTVFDARPDILNHNVETVLRLQRIVRPAANYVRSLSVLARAKATGLTTKSGFMVGLGETDDEIRATLIDMANVGIDIVTIGQYLRPTTNHLPVMRWVTPDQFESYKQFGQSIGISHVQSSPLTRSSYHARDAANAAQHQLVK